MSVVVWKYPLPVRDVVTIAMPRGAQVLHVGVQAEAACLWALVTPDATKEERTFRIAGTGHRLDRHDTRAYIGSFLLFGGSLVFHVFDITEAA